MVAAFFIAVGEEVGVRVLGGLDRSEAVAVGRAIAELPAVAHQTTQAALEMVRTRIESGAYLERGGVPMPEACSVQWSRRDGPSG